MLSNNRSGRDEAAAQVSPDDWSEGDVREGFERAFEEPFEDGAVFEEVDPEEVDGRPAHVVVAFVGPVSAGKGSLIKALFGIDTGDIAPLEGSTKRLRYFEHPTVENVFILDTPGLQDVIEAHSKVTEDVLDRIDLVVFVEGCIVRNTQGLMLIDYPGFLDAAEKTRGHLELGGVVVVMVAERFEAAVVRELRRLTGFNRHLVYVRNKVDLLHQSKRAPVLRKIRRELRRQGLTDIPVVGTCAGPARGESAEARPAQGVARLKGLLRRKLKAAGWDIASPWELPWG